MLKARLLTASGIDFDLPAEIPWVLSTSGWSTFESGGPGTGRTFQVSTTKLRTYSRIDTAGTPHIYGAQRKYSGEDYLLIPGRDYLWTFTTEYVYSVSASGENTYYPRERTADLYTYSDYAGTQDEFLLDTVTLLSNTGYANTYNRYVTLPAGTKCVKFRFWSENQYFTQVTGHAWYGNTLTLV